MTPRTSSLPSEVFLAHSSRDRKFGVRLADVVRGHGVPVWYSESNIVGARQWHDEIGRALNRCDWFVLILSPSSVKSRWVKHELLYALNEPRYDAHIVPVLYQKCDPVELSWTLNSFQAVDFGGRFSSGCEELLRIWGIGYAGPRRSARAV